MLKNVQAVSFTYQAAVADTDETVEERNSAKKLEESRGMFCPKVEVREYQTVPNHLILLCGGKDILFDNCKVLHRAHDTQCQY